jgi:hypothetical protein
MMDSLEKNSRSESKSGSESKPKKEEGGRTGISDAFHRLTDLLRNKRVSNWLWTALGAVTLAILYSLGASRIVFFLGGLVVVGLIVHYAISWAGNGAAIAPTINQSASVKQPAFFVTKTWQSGGPASNGWFVDDNHPNMRRVAVADCQFLVEFTNLKTDPIMIAAYEIGEKTTDGHWKAMERFRLGSVFHGKFFAGNDLKCVHEMKYETFDDAIAGKHIGPHETVRGWMIFRRWPEGELRFELRDRFGIVTTESFSPSILHDFKLAQSTAFPSQPILADLAGNETEDISGLPRW